MILHETQAHSAKKRMKIDGYSVLVALVGRHLHAISKVFPGADNVMPKSLLSPLVSATSRSHAYVSHALWSSPIERKLQNNPFQIATFHFHFFCSSLSLRFYISSLPPFFPKQVYPHGVLSRNSVHRSWVAMAPSHGKMPKQLVSSYSFERVASLGRMILCLPPGLHSWYALQLRSGCSGPPGCTMLYTCLPLVSHL